MSNSDAFDLFIKLDADMVFKDNGSLAKVVNLFREEPELDHGVISLDDWFSDSIIMGMHVYSSRVKWELNEDDLFVDHAPSILGKKIIYWTDPPPLLDHSPNPSPYQAFHFGVHRALKAFQPGRLSLNLTQSKVQWEILKKVWYNFIRRMDRRLGLAVLGATCVIRGRLKKPPHSYRSNELMDLYKQCLKLSLEELYMMLRPLWGHTITRELTHKRLIGPRYILAKSKEFKNQISKYIKPIINS